MQPISNYFDSRFFSSFFIITFSFYVSDFYGPDPSRSSSFALEETLVSLQVLTLVRWKRYFELFLNFRSHSRLPSPTAAPRGSRHPDEVFDPNNPQPCSSRTLLRSTRGANASGNEHDHTYEESSPDFGQRRTSNRAHRIPARFQDDSPPSAATHFRDPPGVTDEEEDDQPLSSRRVAKPEKTLTVKKAEQQSDKVSSTLAASSSSRPTRERKPKKTDVNFKYLNDNESLGEEEESSDEEEDEND